VRVHLVTDRFSLGGGIEHIYQIVRGLTDIRFTVFGEPGPASGKFKNMEHVTIHDTGCAPADLLKGEPAVIHIHHLKPLVNLFKRPFRSYKVPLVYTAHGLHIHKFEFYRTLTAKIKYALRFRLEHYVLPKTHRVIAVSREDKAFMEEKYRLGNVMYLTNGIDFQKISAGADRSRQEIRKQLRFPADAFLCVTVARFDFQKGYDILIDAIAVIKRQLERQDPPCRFIFVGAGGELENMKQYSDRLGVSRYIDFLGERHDVYDILRAADVFLLPSRWEGLPIVLLETGLLKLPVVASDTYGNREIVGKSNGLLFKNLDSSQLAAVIMHMLHGRYDLESYARNLFQEVRENYSLERMLEGLRKLYLSF
jgi:glycosyltransferase involved in cell wall biosynthesis